MVNTKVLFNELEKGYFFPVYLLLGEDEGAKNEFVLQLEEKLFRNKNEIDAGLDISLYHGDETESKTVVETLTTSSFFSGKRLVIVRECEKLKNPEFLLNYLHSPSDSILVLISDRKSISAKLTEMVEQNGRVCVFWPMFQNVSEKWLKSKLEKLGIKADNDVIKYIIEVSGTGTSELLNQIETIANYLSEGENLTLAKAKTIISKLSRYTVFDLCNSLFTSPPWEILKIFRYLTDNGEDLVKIGYFISREIKKLAKARSLKESGCDFFNITKKLGLRKMEAERVEKIIKKINLQTFRLIYSKLASLDLTLKTNPREIGMLYYETFLLALSGS